MAEKTIHYNVVSGIESCCLISTNGHWKTCASLLQIVVTSDALTACRLKVTIG